MDAEFLVKKQVEETAPDISACMRLRSCRPPLPPARRLPVPHTRRPGCPRRRGTPSEPRTFTAARAPQEGLQRRAAPAASVAARRWILALTLRHRSQLLFAESKAAPTTRACSPVVEARRPLALTLRRRTRGAAPRTAALAARPPSNPHHAACPCCSASRSGRIVQHCRTQLRVGDMAV